MPEITPEIKKLLDRHAELLEIIASEEKLARDAEQSAREHRALREVAKTERDEIRKLLEGHKTVALIDQDRASAKQALADAEKSRAEAAATVESLKAQEDRLKALEKSLNEKSAKMDEQIAAAAEAAKPQG